MKGIQALRERRDALAKNLQTLVDKDKTPEWKPEHQASYDQAMAEIGDIDAQMKRHNDAIAAIAANAAENGGIADHMRDQFTRTPGAHGTDGGALRAYLAGGFANMAQEDVQRVRARQSMGDIANAMRLPQGAVDLDVTIVPVWLVADQPVGAQQAAEATAIGTGGRQVVLLVDDQPRQHALAIEDGA